MTPLCTRIYTWSVSPDDKERPVKKQSIFVQAFSFLFFSFSQHTHTPVKVRRRDPSVVHLGTQRWIAAARSVLIELYDSPGPYPKGLRLDVYIRSISEINNA